MAGTETKVCRDCFPFPQETRQLSGLPPKPVIRDVLVLPPGPYKTISRFVKEINRRVRLLLFGSLRTDFTCLIDTGAAFSRLPKQVLDAANAPEAIVELGRPVRELGIVGGQVRRGRLVVHVPVRMVEVAVAHIPPFRLEVKEDTNPDIEFGVLGQNALTHFALLLVPSPGQPMTYVPAAVDTQAANPDK